MSKILILNGSPREKGNTEGLIKAFTCGAEEAGNTVTEFFAVEGFIEVVRRIGNQQVKKAARQKSEHGESVAANGFVDARFRRHGRVGGDARAYKGCIFVCGNIGCLVFGRIH